MALYCWFVDWTPVLLGVEEKYQHGDYTIHFLELRSDKTGRNPRFTYMIENISENKSLYQSSCPLQELQNNRELVMTNIRNKVSEITGIKMKPVIPLSTPKQLSNSDMLFMLLHKACYDNKTDDIKYYLLHINLSEHKDGGNTLLCYSVFNGNLEVTKLLLDDVSVDVHKAHYKYRSPLILAISKGHYEVYKYLRTIVSVPNDIMYQIVCSFSKCSIEDVLIGVRNIKETSEFVRIVKELLEDTSINHDQNSFDDCLGECAYGGNNELVKLFLDHKLTNPMKGDLMMNFIYPTNNRHYDVVKLIINHKKTDLRHEITMSWPWFNIGIEKSEKMILKEAIVAVAKYNDDSSEFIEYVKSK
jgi:hypothetical protein